MLEWWKKKKEKSRLCDVSFHRFRISDRPLETRVCLYCYYLSNDCLKRMVCKICGIWTIFILQKLCLSFRSFSAVLIPENLKFFLLFVPTRNTRDYEKTVIHYALTTIQSKFWWYHTRGLIQEWLDRCEVQNLDSDVMTRLVLKLKIIYIQDG